MFYGYCKRRTSIRMITQSYHDEVRRPTEVRTRSTKRKNLVTRGSRTGTPCQMLRVTPFIFTSYETFRSQIFRHSKHGCKTIGVVYYTDLGYSDSLLSYSFFSYHLYTTLRILYYIYIYRNLNWVFGISKILWSQGLIPHGLLEELFESSHWR